MGFVLQKCLSLLSQLSIQLYTRKSRTYAIKDYPLIGFSGIMSFEKLIEENVLLDVVGNIKQVTKKFCIEKLKHAKFMHS